MENQKILLETVYVLDVLEVFEQDVSAAVIKNF